MNLIKFLPQAIIVGCLAATVQYIDLSCPYIVAWVVFQCWALYFLAGAKIKSALKAGVCYLMGVCVGIGISSLGDHLMTVFNDKFIALPIAVAVLTVPVIYMEKVKHFNLIPAYFIACGGGFFAISNVEHIAQQGNLHIVAVLSSCLLLGFFMGWFSILLRDLYAKVLPETVSLDKAADDNEN